MSTSADRQRCYRDRQRSGRICVTFEIDPVAVEIGAEADRLTAIAFWRDVGPCASHLMASPLIQSAS
jgi:hypothetical protein